MTCPICDNPVPAPDAREPDAKESGANAAFLPFCSERCRNVDLYRWSQGRYAIVEPVDPDQLAEAAGEDADAEW